MERLPQPLPELTFLFVHPMAPRAWWGGSTRAKMGSIRTG